MKDQIRSLNDKNVWKLVCLPADRKAIPVRWTYDLNLDSNEKITRFKAQLVSKGSMQIAGVDLSEVFSPFSKHSSVRLIFALIAQHNWSRISLDIKTAVLNAPLDLEIYVKQLEGFEATGKEGQVYILSETLYGLRQASSLWHQLS